eukprot:1165500-Alexandrium_andersonii.AAC.1
MVSARLDITGCGNERVLTIVQANVVQFRYQYQCCACQREAGYPSCTQYLFEHFLFRMLE